jgi:hypothetical protein
MQMHLQSCHSYCGGATLDGGRADAWTWCRTITWRTVRSIPIAGQVAIVAWRVGHISCEKVPESVRAVIKRGA